MIGRRDFVATVFSKTFLLFLIGPLLPVAMGVIFGGLGMRAEQSVAPPTVAVLATQQEFSQLERARSHFDSFGVEQPLVVLVRQQPEVALDRQIDRLLSSETDKVLGVLYGGLGNPHFKGAVNEDGRTIRQIGLIVGPVNSGVVLVLLLEAPGDFISSLTVSSQPRRLLVHQPNSVLKRSSTLSAACLMGPLPAIVIDDLRGGGDRRHLAGT